MPDLPAHTATVIGIPGGLFVFVFRLRHSINDENRNHKLNQRYAIIYENYTPKCFWWECYSLLRRTLIVSLSVWLSDPLMRNVMMATFAIAFVFMLLAQISASCSWGLSMDTRVALP